MTNTWTTSTPDVETWEQRTKEAESWSSLTRDREPWLSPGFIGYLVVDGDGNYVTDSDGRLVFAYG